MDWVFPPLLLLSLVHYLLPFGMPILLIIVTRRTGESETEELSFSTESYWGSSIRQSSGHLHPLLSWRCLSLQLLAKWGYQAHLNLSLLCEWYRYDPCWYLFLLCSSHSARKSLWDSFHSSSFHSCCEWLAVIISAYEYRNRIVIAIHLKDASICISLLWSNSFLWIILHFPITWKNCWNVYIQ